jgi:rod shape-determining protein MreC
MRDRSSFRSSGGGWRNSAAFGLFLFLALLFFLLDHQGILTPVRSAISSQIMPVMGQIQQFNQRLSAVFAGPMDLQRIVDERDALAKENSDLKAQIIRIPKLELENRRLREQLRIEQSYPWRLVGSEIGVQSLADGRRVAIVGVGSEDGVQVGMAVISRQQSSPPALIGVVDEVGPRNANVLLVSDYSSSVSVQVFRGTLPRDGLLRMFEIERDGEVSAGDTVVTAGLTRLFGPSLPNSAIPSDIPVGIIKEVRLDGRNKVADIQPFIDPEMVNYVWIIQSDVK